MRNHRRRVAFLVGVVSFFLVWGSMTSVVMASQVTEDLKATIDEVIRIVTDEKLKNDKKARREQLRQVIDRKFSYEQMGRRSLAKAWGDRTAEEQREFIDLFGKLLENSYASKIESYHDEKISYVDEKIIKGKYALVKTQIARKDGTINVDYKLIKENGRWMVYDFVIEGVSMIRNYRSQFTKIIRKESYQGLREKLIRKINELENGDPEKASEEL